MNNLKKIGGLIIFVIIIIVYFTFPKNELSCNKNISSSWCKAQEEYIDETKPYSNEALNKYQLGYWSYGYIAGYKDGQTYGTNIRKSETIVGRNDPCPCGSGKKFKKCCG